MSLFLLPHTLSSVRVAGTVVDQTEALIGGVRVVFLDLSSHSMGDTKTDEKGNFTFDRVGVGPYRFRYNRVVSGE